MKGALLLLLFLLLAESVFGLEFAFARGYWCGEMTGLLNWKVGPNVIRYCAVVRCAKRRRGMGMGEWSEGSIVRKVWRLECSISEKRDRIVRARDDDGA